MRIYVVDLKRVRSAMITAFVCILSICITLFLLYVSDAYLFPRSAQTAADGQAKVKTVILDAGHGGEDSGAVGVDGTYEKDINLNIAIAMKSILEEKGFEVVMTRTEDKMLYKEEENVKGIRKISDLKNRCKVAEKYENAVFVSIHTNSFGESKYSGLQVYYADGNDDSRRLAESIQTSVRSGVQPNNNRTVKNGKNLYLLDNCPTTAVLVECGFMSNPDESRKLSEKEYQKELSFSIVCGIIDYISTIN